MALDPNEVPGATLERQLELIWSNIRTILASAGMTVDNIVRLTSYLRDASYADAEANADARVKALGGRPIPTTAIVAQTPRHQLAGRDRSHRRRIATMSP